MNKWKYNELPQGRKIVLALLNFNPKSSNKLYPCIACYIPSKTVELQDWDEIDIGEYCESKDRYYWKEGWYTYDPNNESQEYTPVGEGVIVEAWKYMDYPKKLSVNVIKKER